MVCVRADREGGGRSRVLDIETLRDEVRTRLGSGTLDFLRRTRPLAPGALPRRRGELRPGALRGKHVLAAVHDRDGRGFARDRAFAGHDCRPGFAGGGHRGYARDARLPDARRGLVVRRQSQDAALADALGEPAGLRQADDPELGRVVWPGRRVDPSGAKTHPWPSDSTGCCPREGR